MFKIRSLKNINNTYPLSLNNLLFLPQGTQDRCGVRWCRQGTQWSRQGIGQEAGPHLLPRQQLRSQGVCQIDRGIVQWAPDPVDQECRQQEIGLVIFYLNVNVKVPKSSGTSQYRL